MYKSRILFVMRKSLIYCAALYIVSMGEMYTMLCVGCILHMHVLALLLIILM